MQPTANLIMVAEKGYGDLIIEFACDKIPRFCGALIADDESKRGANDLWGHASY